MACKIIINLCTLILQKLVSQELMKEWGDFVQSPYMFH